VSANRSVYLTCCFDQSVINKWTRIDDRKCPKLCFIFFWFWFLTAQQFEEAFILQSSIFSHADFVYFWVCVCVCVFVVGKQHRVWRGWRAVVASQVHHWSSGCQRSPYQCWLPTGLQCLRLLRCCNLRTLI